MQEEKISEEEWAAGYYNTKMLPLAHSAFELGFLTLARMLRTKKLSNPDIEKVVEELLNKGYMPIVEHLETLAKEDPEHGQFKFGELWDCGVKAGYMTPVALTEKERLQKFKEHVAKAFGPLKDE